MRTLGRTLHKIIKPLAFRQGFTDARVLSHWRNIVGAQLAQQAQPRQLKNGVLSVAVSSGAIGMQIQHQSVQLIERINSHFGFAAVKTIRPIQTYFEIEAAEPAKAIVPDNGAKVRAAAQVEGVKDDNLRDALERLGAQIETRHSKPV